jgi:hypothetical protein
MISFFTLAVSSLQSASVRGRYVRVIAGLKWAPERLPMGEWMIKTAVAPIAVPVNARRIVAFGQSRQAGDKGWKRKIANEYAEIMNTASSIPSYT